MEQQVSVNGWLQKRSWQGTYRRMISIANRLLQVVGGMLVSKQSYYLQSQVFCSQRLPLNTGLEMFSVEAPAPAAVCWALLCPQPAHASLQDTAGPVGGALSEVFPRRKWYKKRHACRWQQTIWVMKTIVSSSNGVVPSGRCYHALHVIRGYT